MIAATDRRAEVVGLKICHVEMVTFPAMREDEAGARDGIDVDWDYDRGRMA